MASNKGRVELMQFLKNLSIETKLIEHPAVFTVEAMMEHLKDIDGVITKNLFLKDKKKKLYLLSAVHTREVKLADIGKKVGASGGLRFADEAVMIDKLGVAQGCCTPLSLLNDSDKEVKFIVDKELVNDDVMVYSHPMENNTTIGMLSADFKKFLEATGHEPVIIDFES